MWLSWDSHHFNCIIVICYPLLYAYLAPVAINKSETILNLYFYNFCDKPLYGATYYHAMPWLFSKAWLGNLCQKSALNFCFRFVYDATYYYAMHGHFRSVLGQPRSEICTITFAINLCMMQLIIMRCMAISKSVLGTTSVSNLHYNLCDKPLYDATY